MSRQGQTIRVAAIRRRAASARAPRAGRRPAATGRGAAAPRWRRRAARDGATARPTCGRRAPPPATGAARARRAWRATRTPRRIRARAAPARTPTAHPAASRHAHDVEAREIDSRRGERGRVRRCGGAIHTTSRRCACKRASAGQRETDLADALALEQDLGQRALRPAAARQRGVERGKARRHAQRAPARVVAAPDRGMRRAAWPARGRRRRRVGMSSCAPTRAVRARSSAAGRHLLQPAVHFLGRTSSTCVAIVHTWPNGSTSVPLRSP